jgi:hypothetical protein
MALHNADAPTTDFAVVEALTSAVWRCHLHRESPGHSAASAASPTVWGAGRWSDAVRQTGASNSVRSRRSRRLRGPEPPTPSQSVLIRPRRGSLSRSRMHLAGLLGLLGSLGGATPGMGTEAQVSQRQGMLRGLHCPWQHPHPPACQGSCRHSCPPSALPPLTSLLPRPAASPPPARPTTTTHENPGRANRATRASLPRWLPQTVIRAGPRVRPPGRYRPNPGYPGQSPTTVAAP